MTKRQLIGGGAAACAACCAPLVLPLLGIAGVGTAATIATFAFAGIVFALVVGLATVITPLVARNARRGSAVGAEASSEPVDVELTSPRGEAFDRRSQR